MEAAPFNNVIHLVDAEGWVIVQKIGNLLLDHADVCAEVIEGQSEFYKFLLLHEHFIRDVINHVFAKDGGRKVLRVSLDKATEKS